MPSRLLSPAEIRDLISILRMVFQYLSDLRKGNSLAEYVQNPKVTPFLSESLAVHLISSGGLIEGVREPRLGGKAADILASTSQGDSIRIEVKGTGTNAWVMLGPKDYAADYLIWIHFDDFFENPEKRSVQVYLINPSEIIGQRDRITLQTLNQMLGDKLRYIELDVISFLDAVA